MSMNVSDKPKAVTALDLLTQERSHSDGPWSLNLAFLLDGTRYFGRILLTSMPVEGLFSESSRMELSRATSEDSNGAGFPADVDGVRSADRVVLNVQVVAPKLRLHPMVCEGVADSEARAYSGEWIMPCADPVGCGCAGMTGTFRLYAV